MKEEVDPEPGIALDISMRCQTPSLHTWPRCPFSHAVRSCAPSSRPIPLGSGFLGAASEPQEGASAAALSRVALPRKALFLLRVAAWAGFGYASQRTRQLHCVLHKEYSALVIK